MPPKGRSRRRMGRYIRGNVNEQLSMAALASKTGVLAAFDETVNERALISSLVARYGLEGLTPATQVGPIMVGVAHSDYTLAEIEEWIESTGTWDEGNKQQQEVGQRLIRRIGVFETSRGAAAIGSSVLNDGKAIKTKLNWILNQGQTLNLWVYNLGNAAVATTTPIVTAEGHVNLFPK